MQTLLTSTDPKNYDFYLEQKINKAYECLQNHNIEYPKANIYKSSTQFYRMRAEFAIFHDNNEIQYVMFKPKTKPREKIFIEGVFDIASKHINDAMLFLKTHLKDCAPLKDKLFEADFITNSKGDVVITLTYHKKLDDDIATHVYKLKNLAKDLNLSLDFVLRAKKQVLIFDKNYVIETYDLEDGSVNLIQIEGSFTQPNASACKHMLNFAKSCAKDCKDTDLIELYCGSGTFTVALAPYFRQVFATEVTRVATKNAIDNIALNNINNVKIARLSANEASEAIFDKREFNRLKLANINLNEYDFKTLLIDPPRQGLHDKEALELTAKFDRVIYISCNVETLAYDLQYLQKTHKVKALSFFDQFPYTNHLESGVLLERK